MKPEIKEKWLEALRSGRYTQARENLKKVDAQGRTSYCCLGVLSEIMEVPSKPRYAGDRVKSFQYPGYTSASGYPDPDWAREVCDLTNDEMYTLAEKNDSGDSFEMIADYIEEKL